MRVLIAEDNALVAMLIEDVLEDEGHEVIGSVPSAKVALDLVERRHPDLLIADINLVDGESGCELVHDAHSRCGTPALFVTGSPDKAKACDTAIGVLGKPFSPETLRAAVQAAAAIMKGKTPGRIPPELRLFAEFQPRP